MSANFASLREILSRSPSWENWNLLVATLEQWEIPEERETALHYTKQHLDSDWPAQWRLGNQQWAEDSIGWELVKGRARYLESSFTADERWVPPGTFAMGGNSCIYRVAPNEEPETQVTLTRPFWTLNTPVTLSFWMDLMKRDPMPSVRGKGRDLFPVVFVNRFEAVRFCNALSEAEGLEPAYEPANNDDITELHCRGLDCEGYRLPTEAEWEWMARAGRQNPTTPMDPANFWEKDADPKLRPVKKREANPWGLHDLLSSTWELCEDLFREYTGKPTTDPVQLVSQDERYRERNVSNQLFVARGGKWRVLVSPEKHTIMRRQVSGIERVADVTFRPVRTDLRSL